MFDWISRQNEIVIYAFLFLSAAFETVFPPYPSDAFVLVFSFLAGRGLYSPYLLYALTTVGSLTGIMFVHWAARKHGDGLMRFLSGSWLGRLFPLPAVDRLQKKFRERGDAILLLNRFLPGMRAPIIFVAGIVGIGPRRVFCFSLISVLVWNAFLITAGFYVGATWDEASRFLRNYTVVAVAILIVILSILTAVYFRKRSSRRTADRTTRKS